MEITAECERKAGAWRVRVPQLDNLLISTKRLDSATEQIKDLVHEYQGIDRCEVIVKVETSMPGIMCDLELAQSKMREANRLQEEASKEIREVVSRLRTEGLSMRDIGVLLGISPQRVAQLAESSCV
jgi:DNA-directed RNA polymerase specialized sigma24 family protein